MGTEKLKVRLDKKRVKEIYGNKCANLDWCHSEEKPHIHHIVFKADHFPRSEIENKANYIPLCTLCERITHSLAR